MLKWPKPPTWVSVKAERKRKAAEARAACVEAVFLRHGSRCARCGRPVKKAADPALRHEFEIGAVHEIAPRSLGGDPTDPDACELLCLRHHQMAHGLRVSA